MRWWRAAGRCIWRPTTGPNALPAIFRLPPCIRSRRRPSARRIRSRSSRSFWTIWRGVRQASEVIRRIKPEVVVGFGGYPTLPPLYAATRRNVPTIIHEQNAVMGRANKALAAKAAAIAGGFLSEGSGRYADKTVVTGNPVRPAVLEAATTPYAPSQAGEPFRLLVFGGSQGAQFFSDAMPAAIAALAGGAARAAEGDAAGARRGRRPGQGRLCRARHGGAGAAVLHRHGGADRRRASGHFALRRLDGFGDRGDRPAGAAGALSACARPRPGGERGGACGGRRRRGACRSRRCRPSAWRS